MSETVASALQLVREEHTGETWLFFRMMDRLFDAVNVKNPLEGGHKRKDSRAPYYTHTDERFLLKVMCTLILTTSFQCELYISSLHSVAERRLHWQLGEGRHVQKGQGGKGEQEAMY